MFRADQETQMTTKLTFLLAGVLAGMLATSAFPQSTMPSDTMDHSAMTKDMDMQAMGGAQGGAAAKTIPTEPGQGAFAAIAEIVAMLRDDPHTDWREVDIEALRDHLVDMDMLVTETQLSAKSIDGGLEMQISLAGRGGAAAGRMVPMHGPFLARATGWKSDVQQGADAIVWRVTSADDAAQIRALGFYGLMGVGQHHQVHHLGIATGQMMH